MIINNPFEHFYPEDLMPEEIISLFIKEYTEHNSLTAYKHTIVEGSRGSGKSMLFKYLEPACQALDNGGWDKFMLKPRSFIGVYINCNTGDYRKKEFEELLKSDQVPSLLARKIIVHDFIMRICEWTVNTLLKQFDTSQLDGKLISEIINALDSRHIHNDFTPTLMALKNVVHHEINLVRESTEEFYRKYALPGNNFSYAGNLTEPSLSEGSFLSIFFGNLRKAVNAEKIPFFLLFDEAGKQMLLPTQQELINTFMTQRVHSLICVKVSVRPESYVTDIDLNGNNIQHVHDYDTINLDALYTNNTQSYYQRILEISNRRLELANFVTKDIREFIPEREFEKEKMREAERLTAEEYDELPKDRKPEDKQNYVSKYARARFFQVLYKAPYWYTGFDNLVHFSAGITRSFLDPCFDMVGKYMQKNPEASMEAIEFIPFEIQWETIRAFSDDFMDKELLGRIHRRDPSSIERKQLEYLFTLIESLGEAFKERLKNRASRVPRIISFSIKETILTDRDLEAVLQLGLQNCFFQKRWYRGKSGREMLECYILNRRLCPRYGLDLSGFQGRIELSQESLRMAMADKQGFLRWFLSKEKTGEVETSQLELFSA